jgi:hypothetical protein
VGPRAVLDTVVKRRIPSPLRESKPHNKDVNYEFINMLRGVFKYFLTLPFKKRV